MESIKTTEDDYDDETQSLEIEMSSSSSSKNFRKQQSINPFEETNRYRLDKSILSPNLFHVTTTSTPEVIHTSVTLNHLSKVVGGKGNPISLMRDINNLWNIDQKAILFPADIPTDDNSLIAQYTNDHKLTKQVNAAVEAFWSQNKVIIESPASSVAAFKTKLKKSCLSNMNSPYELNQNHQTIILNSNKKDQTCQTLLSLPSDVDLTKIPELKAYIQESPTKELNNSIRKKLFDPDNDESAPCSSVDHQTPTKLNKQQTQFFKSHTQSPCNSISSSTNWTESIGFQDQFSSSPKFKDTNSTPELSPLIHNTLKTPNQIYCQEQYFFSPGLLIHHHQQQQQQQQQQQHHADLLINSPNLSPIKEDNTLKIKEDEQQHPNESSPVMLSKSVIFMDIDTGSILKTPRGSSTKTSINKFEPIVFNNELDGLNMSISCSNDTFKTLHSHTNVTKQTNNKKEVNNSSKTLATMTTYDCIENTTNQESGYQTGGSTQCNLMDITNNQQSSDFKIKLTQSQSIDTLKENQHKQLQSLPINNNNNNTNEMYKTQSSHSLPSLASLYPLGSSTPETSKHYFDLDNSLIDNSINYIHEYNKNLSLLKTCDYLSNKININCNRLDHDFDDYDADNDDRNEFYYNNCDFNLGRKLNESYMDHSILKYKTSASEYARLVIQKAMKDLNESKNIKLHELNDNF